jgi:hypothetical protein
MESRFSWGTAFSVAAGVIVAGVALGILSRLL